MTRYLIGLFLAISGAGCTTPQALQAPANTPVADHHQHVISPQLADLIGAGSQGFKPILAADVVALMDLAGIQRAAVLSAAYIYASRNVPDEYAAVRAENDWAAAQAAQYPQRLRAFCGFNPLRDYALDELARCAANPQLRHGIKLHFGNSDVQLDDPDHVEQLVKVFRAANANRMAIAVHTRASISRKRPYGEKQAHIFLDKLLPAAPDVTVQVAHMAGSGPGYDDLPAQEVMAVLADAMLRGDPRTRRLWFDVATVVTPDITPTQAQDLARRIRHVGVDRIVYGSDAAAGTNLRPREGWAAFKRLPLTEAEFARIARNVAPYLR